MTGFKKIQMEQLEWSARNFGNTPAHRPLLGMIEELCELSEAEAEEDELDAVGDVGIYMLDYCNRRGWDMQVFWDTRATPGALCDETYLQLIGKLAHHHLKGEQNIRGGTAAHDDHLRMVLAQVVWVLDNEARLFGTTFPDVLEKVWAKVSKRDWTKNPNNAHEVADG